LFATGRLTGILRLAAFQRLRPSVDVEPELVIAHPHHIRTPQNTLAIDPLSIDERPVGAGIPQEITLGSRNDLCMPTGDSFARDHDVTASLPSQNEGGAQDGIFSSVRQTHEPPVGGAPSAFRALCPKRLVLSEFFGRNELRASTSAFVDEEQFVAPKLDLVSV
jgi:hypothetical protein